MDSNSLQNTDFIYLFINEFILYLLDLIYFSYNPTSNIFNYDYYYATLILNVFKYFCEEHNEIFQTLFYKIECGKIKNAPFTFIDFLLMALNKIILISNFDLCDQNKDLEINYFLDIFHSIVEFLIESIQGTTVENLKTLESSSSMLLPFIKSVKSFLIYNKSDFKTIYEVKIDIMNLILALLEENNCPNKIGLDISIEIYPKKILSNLKMIIKKLYIKLENLNLSNYKDLKINHNIYQYFLNKYFYDETFKESLEFQLALRLFQIFKILSTRYKIKDAISIVNCIEELNENDIYEMTGENFSISKVFPIFKNVAIYEEKANRLNKEKICLVENYFILKLFNEIIKIITIKVNENETCNVYFSINPLCRLISNNSMNEFIENVDRDSRFTKLFDLMNYCDTFLWEIEFNLSRVKNFKMNRIFNKLNYNFIHFLLFLLTLIINILLMMSMKNNNKTLLEQGNENYISIIRSLGIFQIIVNFGFLSLWLYTRFHLYYGIKLKNYLSYKEIPEDKISLFAKLKLVGSIFLRSEIISYIYIIVLGIIAIYRPINHFCFGFQLLTIVNLSKTLKNILKAIIIRCSQLISTFAFMLILIYCYGIVGFFFMNESFGHKEVYLQDGTIEVFF